MREKGTTDLDVWNMDETGFRIGCGKAQLVVIMDRNKPFRMIDPENRDYVTSVECIGSAGETTPPMLLVSGDPNILHKWCQHNDLDGDIVIGTTETGYAVLEWLQNFIDHTQNKRRGAWLLFIIDGYGSYMTIPFHNLATENKIVCISPPTTLIYLTQPLHVGVFQPFKHYHRMQLTRLFGLVMKNLENWNFWPRFSHFATKPLNQQPSAMLSKSD